MDRDAGFEVGERPGAELDLAAGLEGEAAVTGEDGSPWAVDSSRSNGTGSVGPLDANGVPFDLDAEIGPGRGRRRGVEAVVGDDAARVVEGEDRLGGDHLPVAELRGDPVLVADRIRAGDGG